MSLSSDRMHNILEGFCEAATDTECWEAAIGGLLEELGTEHAALLVANHLSGSTPAADPPAGAAPTDPAEPTQATDTRDMRQLLRISLLLLRAETERATLGQLWSLNGQGVVLLARSGQSTYLNAEAQAMIQAGIVHLRRGRLMFKESVINRRLSGLIETLQDAAAATCHESVSAITRASGEEIGVRFLPCNDPADRGSMLAVLLTPLARLPDTTRREMCQFGSLFNLTPAEQRLAGAVATNQSLVDYARSRGIAVETARKYLKSVLSKTNCRNQKELVRLVERFCFLTLR